MSRALSASDSTCERRQCQRLSRCRRSAASCMTDNVRPGQYLDVLNQARSFGRFMLCGAAL